MFACAMSGRRSRWIDMASTLAATNAQRRILPPYAITWHSVRKAVIRRDNGVCGICGKHPANPEVHHKTPLSEGGSNKLENLVTLCHECHQKIHRQMSALQSN